MAQIALHREFSIPDELKDIIAASAGRGPIATMIRDYLWTAINLLNEQIVVRTPSNTGNLSGAISQAKHVTYGRGVWDAVITDGGVVYGLPVNYGRKPGKRPPIDDIEYWVKRRKIQWMIDRKTMPPRKATTREMAWAIAVSIALHGTFAKEGPPMMFERGMEAASPYIEDLWDQLMGDISAWWETHEGAYQ